MTRDQQQSTYAGEIKETLLALAPHIERHTSRTCPDCVEVCCRQEHGRLREQDIAYLAALGEGLPVFDAGRMPDAPCQFLEDGGCSKPRWQRAWKCTWFFCEPLLRSLAERPQRESREMTRMMNRIMELRSLLGGEHREERIDPIGRPHEGSGQ